MSKDELIIPFESIILAEAHKKYNSMPKQMRRLVDINDLLQEGRLSVYTALMDNKHKHNINGYVRIVARNACNNYCKRFNDTIEHEILIDDII